MKCHAGVEFPSGKPCPKCGAELGEVCWPGINRDLLELPKLREALLTSTTMMEALLVQLESWGHASAVNARGQIFQNEELLK